MLGELDGQGDRRQGQRADRRGHPRHLGLRLPERRRQEALAKYPDIKVVGTVAGMWTDQVAQAEIQKWLATNPGQLDGIIIQSASELGALRALKQIGPRHDADHHRRRDRRALLLAQEPGLCHRRRIQAWPPGDDFEMGWNIMMRTLQGQGPKVQSILTKPQVPRPKDSSRR